MVRCFMIFLSLLFLSLHLKASQLDPNILKLKEQIDFAVKTQQSNFQCSANQENSPFICTDFKTPNQCLMKKCSGKILGYDQNIDVFIPQNINRLSVYFHGHILAGFEKYSNSITNTNDPSKLKEKICSSTSATIMPQSTGACSTFDTFFKTSAEFNQFINDVSVASSIPNSSSLPISISGHSGGGRTLARILNGTIHKVDGRANERIDLAVFYDGIYNDWQPDMISNWVKNSTDVKLTMVALAPIKPEQSLSPYKNSNLILKKISGQNNLPHTSLMIQSKTYTKTILNQNSNQVQVLTTPTIDGLHTQSHFDVIKETWSEINQK
jgi:hypothetical protein